MTKKIKLKQGLDIAIDGRAELRIGSSMYPDVFAVVPDHFAGITPKLTVKEGEKVKAGTPLFHDKKYADMNFVAPVSGEVLNINRGERRKIMSITIKANEEQCYENFGKADLDNMNSDDVKAWLLRSGLWYCIKQRPYDVIANPTVSPRAVFVSTFDSAPLAPDYEFIAHGKMHYMQAAINAFAKISGKLVEMGLKAGSAATDFRMLHNVNLTEFDGPHPAGNVGVQIHHIAPINKGETVWTINLQDLLIIGKFLCDGIVDMTRLVALTGPEAYGKLYYNVKYGTTAHSLLYGNVHREIPLRYICGNVLSGYQIEENEVLSPYTNQVTVLDEGSETHELLGWAMPRFNKFSVSNTYLTNIFRKIFPDMHYDFDARLLGGRRAIIMSGEYDKVLPMDIYMEFLIKAMIAGNIDKMEALGAYEIAPEDVALCEFVCTSKMPLQAIVRKALDNMRSELE